MFNIYYKYIYIYLFIYIKYIYICKLYVNFLKLYIIQIITLRDRLIYYNWFIRCFWEVLHFKQIVVWRNLSCFGVVCWLASLPRFKLFKIIKLSSMMFRSIVVSNLLEIVATKQMNKTSEIVFN